MAFTTGIIMHFFAIFVEHGLFPAAIFEAMEMDLYAGVVQEPDLVKQVEDATVIDGIWHVQTNDM